MNTHGRRAKTTRRAKWDSDMEHGLIQNGRSHTNFVMTRSRKMYFQNRVVGRVLKNPRFICRILKTEAKVCMLIYVLLPPV